MSDDLDTLTSSERTRLAVNLTTGIFHLRLAIEAFDSLGYDTDTSELHETLGEARGWLALVQETLK